MSSGWRKAAHPKAHCGSPVGHRGEAAVQRGGLSGGPSSQGKQARRVQEEPAGTPTLRYQPRFGVGMTRRPVFRREGDVPESRIGQEKLHTHLDWLARKLINVRNHTLERAFGL